jgi:hypothetical protein|tara:strand:- start:6787 stop:6969 length:183 start_codon:yes stop_codon:yes gene_type:complete
MGILSKLQSKGSPLSNGNGATPPTPEHSSSTLHGKIVQQSSSNLDLNGATPSKYSDNLPQ